MQEGDHVPIFISYQVVKTVFATSTENIALPPTFYIMNYLAASSKETDKNVDSGHLTVKSLPEPG